MSWAFFEIQLLAMLWTLTGTDYTYSFVAHDDQGNSATATAPIDAPDVVIVYRVYLPLILKNVGPPVSAPTLDAIANPDGDYQYTVSWGAVELATSYTLQEDDNAAFTSPTAVYVGSSVSKLVYAPTTGTFYYRVKASNAFGDSAWSNIQSVIVTIALPPCPQAGAWSGSGNHFSVDFEVAQAGTSCWVQNITGHLSATCCGSGSCWSLYVEFILSMTSISNHQFDASGSGTHVKGTFTTPTTVEGTWSYYQSYPYPPATCTGSGTWTGSP